MKLAYLLSAVSLFLAPAARAGVSVDALGFESGANINSYSTSPNAATSAKAGLVLGAAAELPLARLLYLQPGLRFVQKGFNFSDASVAQLNVDATGTADYLELPLLLKLKFDQLHPWSPFLFAGPAVAYRIGASASRKVNGVDTGVDSLAFSTWDFSALFGLGADYQFSGSLRGFLQAEFADGFTNASSIASLDWKSRGVLLTAGLMFPL